MSANLGSRPLSDYIELDPQVQALPDLDTEVSFIPMADVSDSGEWVTRQTRPLRNVANGYTRFAEGDVLFAKITPCMENGKGAHATGLVTGLGFGSTEFFVLRAKEGVAPRFIYHWSQAPALRKKAEAFMIGSAGQQRVRPEFFQNFQIADVPLPEQRKIASILDTADTAIRRTEATIAKLQQMKQGLLHDLLTRGLNDNGELRDPVRHPEQFRDSPLGRIPRAWEVESLGVICRRNGGILQTGPFGSQLHSYEYVSEGIPVVMPQDILNGRVSRVAIAQITEKKAEALARHKLQPNDVVLSRRGDLQRSAVISDEETGWLCGTGCILARVPGLHPFWLTSVHQHEIGQRQILQRAVGSTMVNINTTILGQILLPVPSAVEQAESNKRVNSIISKLQSEIESAGKKRLQKQGLMDDLLTGRVRVAV